MSNEYKDWLYDKVQDVVLEVGVVDKVIKVRPCQLYDAHIVEGLKNGQKVKFEVWFDSVQEEWKYERREL